MTTPAEQNWVDAQLAEQSAQARDAQRYRWLRGQHWSDGAIACVVKPKYAVRLGSYCPSLELLDAAIDAELDRKGVDRG